MSDITVVTVVPSGIPQIRPVSSLRIVIPGGEGHLGRLLARRFSSLGHSVTTLTRNPRSYAASTTQRKQANNPKSWKTANWDGRSLGPWAETLEHADVVVNLAGRSVDCRYTEENRAEILRSRVESTAVLAKAIQAMKSPPRLWLNASTATIYRHTFERDMDESTGELGGNEPDAPASWRFSIDVAREWERSFFASATPGTRKIAMRSAMVMSSEAGGVFEALVRLVRTGLGGPWGSGRQYMSWIHEEDFFRAVEFLIAREGITGVVNLAAPRPLPNEEFLSELRNAWGIGFGLPATEWMLTAGAFVLRTETELLLKSRRVVPGVLQKNGFAFRFPEWPEAARDLVERWKAKDGSGAGKN